MHFYLVGGAVRNQLLELPVYERDRVVVGATEEEMLEAGYARADAEFPVFIHPQSGEEYALARREEKTGPGYKGLQVYAGPDVGLEVTCGVLGGCPRIENLLRLLFSDSLLETVDVQRYRQQGLEGTELGRALRSRQLELLAKRLREASTDA